LLFDSLFIFRWGSVVEQIPGLWTSPQDLWITFFNSSEFVHGHFGSVYSVSDKFVEFPGILLALAPLSALSSPFHTTALELTRKGAVPAPGFSVSVQGASIPFQNAQALAFSGHHFVLRPLWVAFVDPYVLMLSCSALFAFGALAESLQVSRRRRILLALAEAILLWNVAVIWGHPEDAIALALATYALVFVLDRRFVGAGWLMGAAIAFQPLVLLMLPVLLAVGGRQRAVGMLVRSGVPSAVLLVGPLIANAHATFRALVDQPSPPGVNHVTPWTSISPSLGGGLVAAGPVRLIGIALGFWVARHWRARPELIAWSCAAALALRSLTESVMTPYYSWAALALGVVVIARAKPGRFGVGIAAAVAATVTARWALGWLPWWLLQVGLLAVLLLLAAPVNIGRPKGVRAAAGRRAPGRSRADHHSRRVETMTGNSLVRLLCSACFVGGVVSMAGCSSSSSGSSRQPATVTSVASPGASVPYRPSNNARHDVSSGTCTESAQGWTLHGTVKNPGPDTKSFQIVVDFVSRPGFTVLATNVVEVHQVPPGRTTAWTVIGAKGESGVTCIVRLAQSL
jgi:hypothetical protein